jgi:hypothetical protein
VKKTLQTVAAVIVAALMVSTSLFAHHAWTVDTTRAITIKGTVTGFDWSNPHVQIFMDTKDDKGNPEKWTAGGPSPSRMAGTGWDRNSVKPGDVITAIGHRATDAPNLMKMDKVVFADGRTLVGYGS